MNAKQLNLGYQYSFDENNKSISFFKEHGLYVVCGFSYYSDNTVAGFYETFETFATAKKYFNNAKL